MKEQEINDKARARLIEVLRQVPALRVQKHHQTGSEAGPLPGPRHDITLRVEIEGGRTWLIHGEVKKQAHPKQVRDAILQIKAYARQQGDGHYHVLVAPYVSAESARICREEGVGHLDLSGNCHLSFERIYHHVEGRPNRFKDIRPLRSIFSPKTSRLLRVLLQGPLLAHRVVNLAEAAGVSLGLVSKLRTQLRNHEWAEETREGLKITKPDAILDAWSQEDRWEKRTAIRDYSLLVTDPQEIAHRVHEHLGGTRHAFTQWFAAHLRHPHTAPPIASLYVSDFPDEASLKTGLGARRVDSGGRLRLIAPEDEGVFLCGREADGLPLVSDVQIYLDVLRAGLRGEEAAKELRDWDDFSGGWS